MEIALSASWPSEISSGVSSLSTTSGTLRGGSHPLPSARRAAAPRRMQPIPLLDGCAPSEHARRLSSSHSATRETVVLRKSGRKSGAVSAPETIAEAHGETLERSALHVVDWARYVDAAVEMPLALADFPHEWRRRSRAAERRAYGDCFLSPPTTQPFRSRIRPMSFRPQAAGSRIARSPPPRLAGAVSSSA